MTSASRRALSCSSFPWKSYDCLSRLGTMSLAVCMPAKASLRQMSHAAITGESAVGPLCATNVSVCVDRYSQSVSTGNTIGTPSTSHCQYGRSSWVWLRMSGRSGSSGSTLCLSFLSFFIFFSFFLPQPPFDLVGVVGSSAPFSSDAPPTSVRLDNPVTDVSPDAVDSRAEPLPFMSPLAMQRFVRSLCTGFAQSAGELPTGDSRHFPRMLSVNGPS
mmetsp:Transcript_36341/g.113954  ORF Transcript_36341/g.113954 Transcript_36341/m.113954 type:complete len:217 (-) Transcript_36341:490-1140(-)